jgi:hypothetical protein
MRPESPESLEARLLALPPPPVPVDLESRLLAAIPTRRLLRRRWIVLAGVLAAACLLAVLAWPRRDVKRPGEEPGTKEPVVENAPRDPDESDRMAAFRRFRRDLDETVAPTFHWPLPETLPTGVSTTLPPDLLD